MNIKNKSKFVSAILIITFLVVALIFPIIGSIDQANNYHKINNVDCYDKNSNKIIGQVCEEPYNSVFLSIGSICMLIAIGIMLLHNVFNMEEDYDKPTNFFGVEQ
jgi:hypothetical protein